MTYTLRIFAKRGVRHLLAGLALATSLVVSAGDTHAAPRPATLVVCGPCHLLQTPPSLLAVGYSWYGYRELDVLGNNLTPYTYARIVIADKVTGQVIRTDYDYVGEGGALLSIGRDGSAVDGAMIFYLPLDSCGAYRNRQTGNFDALSVQAYDGSTGLGSNVLTYQSACL